MTAALALAILVSLGTWQLRRLAWKQDLLARIESRFDGEPVDLSPAAAWTEAGFVDKFEYRPVRVTGSFHQPDAGASDFRHYYVYTVLSAPRGQAGGQGYWVFDLFHPTVGGALYVNRGFVPRAERGTELGPPPDEVTVVGVVRKSSGGNFFTPRCERADGICYASDVEGAAARARLSGVAPFYLDLREDSKPGAGLPQAGETRVRFPNNHLQYAVTWFGLAAALVFVVGGFLRSGLRTAGGSGVTGDA